MQLELTLRHLKACPVACCRKPLLHRLECRHLYLVYENPAACSATDFDLQGQEWVRMVVLGQSFMLHQIRKLVGTAVAVMRGEAPPECIQLALQPERNMVRPTSFCQQHAEFAGYSALGSHAVPDIQAHGH